MNKNDNKDNNLLDFPSLSSEEEDSLVDSIKKDSENIQIPSSIEPKNMKNFLLSNPYKNKKNIMNMVNKKMVSIAACALLVITIGSTMYFKTTEQKKSTKNSTTVSGNSYDKIYDTLVDIDDYEKSLNDDSNSHGLLDFLFGSRSYDNETSAKSVETDGAASENSVESADTAAESSKSTLNSSKSSTTKGSSTSTEYSKTNTQVEGIDEADVIKNDGQYIYCYTKNNNRYTTIYEEYDDFDSSSELKTPTTANSFGNIFIVKADGDKLTASSKITLNNNFSEFYINDDKLIVIGISSKKLPDVDKKTNPNTIDYDGAYSINRHNSTIIDIYDISNKSKPVLLNSLSQDGIYNSSRLNDGYLYIFSKYNIRANYIKDDIKTFIPEVNKKTMEASSIYLPSNTLDKSYMILTSIKLSESDNYCSEQAILSNGNNFYVSNKNIYIADSCRYNRNDKYNSTIITKFAYSKGKINFENSQTIKGTIHNSFSMDEYKDNLRLVSTVSKYNNNAKSNSLYILNSNLKIVGIISDLAHNEEIKSARFMGEYGYFVTFRNMDPLFAVDLSNPAKPNILSELKITGFSSYLHFYSDNLLLGIGEEVDPNTSKRKGLKLSMFDISDPKNVNEINKIVLDKYNSTTALTNHKAVMIDTKKNILGFCAHGYNSQNITPIKRSDFNNYTDYQQALRKNREVLYNDDYLTFSYDKNKGFSNNLTIDLKTDFQRTNNINYSSFRGTYINNTLYIISNTGDIVAYDLKDGKKLNSIHLS